MPRKVLGKRALRELDPNATAVGTGNPPAKKKAVPSALLGLEDPVGSSAEESALCPATINPEDMAGSACSVGGKGRKKKAPAAPAKDEQMIPSHVPLPATEPKSNPSDNSHIHVADVPAPAAAASGLRGPSRPRRARFRVPRGPVPAYPVDRKTEQGKPGVFLPRVVPEEWLTTLGEIGNLIPQSLCRGVDGTPNRELTLRNEVWWATHGEWVKSHKAKLGLTPDLIAKYRTEAAALADAPPKEKQSEGKGPRNGKKRSARRDGEPYLIMGPFGPVLGELDPSHLGTGDNDFVCIPRPHWDLCDDPEYSSDDDLDDSDGSDSERRPSKEQLARRAKRIEIGKKAGFYIEKQLAYLHPEYKWTMTLLGWERYLWWTQESAKRDQDVTGCYFYNDYSWYGDVEVVENIVSRTFG